MKKEIILYILLIFGIFIILFLGIRYSLLLKEREALQNALVVLENKLTEYKKEMDSKEKEFSEKISELSSERIRLMKEIGEINEKLLQTQNLLSQIKEEEKKLRAENFLLAEKAKKLETELYSLNEEKLELERRLSSLTELRKAIREVKMKERQKRIEEVKRRNIEGLRLGNRGYLIKDGKPTLTLKYIIRVLPPQIIQE